ncbi:UBN2 2 domain containing protein, partial [Asbolus verrucosus]
MSPTQLKHLRNCETSKEVWDKLKSVYASQGPIRKATLLEQLLSLKLSEGEDVRDHLSRFMDTVDKLHGMNIEINGDLLSVMLLHSLPDSFD